MKRNGDLEADLIPEYSLNPEKKKRKNLPKWLRNSFAVVLIAAIVLYMPPIVLQSRDEADVISLEADVSAVLRANQYLKDHPDVDFDEDGLDNAKELQTGTDPYRVDTDGDGITDAGELAVTETNPVLYNNTMLDISRKNMTEADNDIQTPFKINNVVMWPDDLESRTYGAVVKTLNGYRFCNYKGWALFPEGSYVYKVEDGIHHELRRNSEGAAYISGKDMVVEVYGEPLNMLYQFSCCGQILNFRNKVFGELLRFILPEEGPALLSCRKLADIDLDPNVKTGEEAMLYDTVTGTGDSRFGRNHILLSDLARVRNSIENNEAVITSLFSPVRGESIVVVYGYTAEGDLLAADPDTGEKLGEIQIEERASRLYDQSGEIIQYEWFVFEGLGFSSYSKDRISFHAAVLQ